MERLEWGADWSNEFTLEFLEQYKSFPCIWNPKNIDYKNKHVVSRAWEKMADILSVPSKELKRKKESLMACFRIHVNKTKSSLASGRVYKTSWFAYELMTSFLHPLYYNEDQYNSTLTTEPEDEQNVVFEESIEDPILYTIKKSPKRRCSEELELEEYMPVPDPLSSHYISKKSRIKESKKTYRSVSPSSFNRYKQNTDSSLQTIKSEVKRLATNDESQMFANFLAVRLRKFGEIERAKLMNDIENLMYQAKRKNFVENEGNGSQSFENEAGSTSKENVESLKLF